MFFRNLTFFRFPTTHDFSRLDELLPEAALKPVGPLELSSRGFISPFGRGEDLLSHRIGDAIWLAVGGEDKILPGSVVNDLLAQKVAELEEREGRKLGGRARKRLKDDLLHELLPRAFVKSSRTDALLDLEHGFLAVDSSSRKSAEAVASEIRRALGSFPAIPPNAEVAPRSILTGWIAGEPMPDGLTLGEECELKDAMDGGAVVKAQHQELLSEAGAEPRRPPVLRPRRGPGGAQAQVPGRGGGPAGKHRARRPARRTGRALRAAGRRSTAPVPGAGIGPQAQQGRSLTPVPHPPAVSPGTLHAQASRRADW